MSSKVWVVLLCAQPMHQRSEVGSMNLTSPSCLSTTNKHSSIRTFQHVLHRHRLSVTCRHSLIQAFERRISVTLKHPTFQDSTIPALTEKSSTESTTLSNLFRVKSISTTKTFLDRVRAWRQWRQKPKDEDEEEAFPWNTDNMSSMSSGGMFSGGMWYFLIRMRCEDYTLNNGRLSLTPVTPETRKSMILNLQSEMKEEREWEMEGESEETILE